MVNAQLYGVLRHLRGLRDAQALTEAPDAQLLEWFARGHEEAPFAALVRRHGPMVWGVSRRVLRHEQDAEDVFQATFLLLARKADSIRKAGSVGSWLHGVAHRLALKARLQQARRQSREKRAADMRTTRPGGETSPSDVQAALDAALGELPEKYRAALVLCYLEGKTQGEAARHLGCPLATVRTRVARGRKLLRDRLAGRGLALSAAGLAALLIASAAPAAAPAALVRAAVRAGLAFAAGQPAAALCSRQAAGLVEGGLRALFPTKVKAATALLLAVALVAGAGALAQRAPAARARPVETQQRAVGNQKPGPPAAKESAKPPAAGKKGDSALVSGRVVGADGMPVAGAKLYLWTGAPKKDMPVRATTAADGRFRFTATRAELGRGAKVVATAREHGPDWAGLTADQQREVNLRLVQDTVPITGRLFDLEGRPIVGATVQVAGLDQGKDGDLKAWFKARERYAYFQFKHLAGRALDGPTTVHTGKDGRFRLTGFGRDRVVYLSIEGPKIENTFIHVVTRAGPVPGKRTGFLGVFPASFDLVIGPSRPVVGTVRERGTGKPLAGIQVTWLQYNRAHATTDARGRYRLEGVGKHPEYTVAAEGMPYINCTRHDIPDAPGLGPLTVDFELQRGIPIKGRLTDRATGKPVQGWVSYLALADNPRLKDFPAILEEHFHPGNWGHTDADGSFTELAIPGPGLLCVRANDAGRFLRATNTEGWKVGPPTPVFEQYHAIVPINPSEKDPKSTRVNITLRAGRAVAASVVGPDGKPLAGAHVAGRGAVFEAFFFSSPKLETASFVVGALEPGKPRTVVVIHAGKKLARVCQVRADEKGPITIRLRPLAVLTGRIRDAHGRPRAGLTVSARMRFKGQDREELPCEFLDERAWGKLTGGKATTDGEGRFRIQGLVPGLKYLLNVRDGAEILPDYNREVSALVSGETTELGDLKGKSSPGR
jgi:RNA polymerase sigma factor (sigma-70 family)